MQRGRQILSPERFKITLQRLASQIIENYGPKEIIHIIGIQEKGVVMAERIVEIIEAEYPKQKLKLGKLDITFYRDDYRMRESPLKANATHMDFDIDATKLLLVDDVLYTGRTIQAAMSSLQDLGRAAKLELMTMVDRRYNRHLPIKSDYTGIEVDALDEAYVSVEWEHQDGQDKIMIYSAKKKG